MKMKPAKKTTATTSASLQQDAPQLLATASSSRGNASSSSIASIPQDVRPEPGTVFRHHQAAIRIQRASRVMISLRRGNQGRPAVAKRQSRGIMGVVLTGDAMRGGHIDDRTGRVLKRLDVDDQRRTSVVDREAQRLRGLLQEDEFDPSAYCSAEVADMKRDEHARAHTLELQAWEGLADWSMPLDTKAIERRLAVLKPQPRAEARNARSKRYLPQRPATAAGLGVRAARSLQSLRPRPGTAPAAFARRRVPVELRVVFRLVLAAGRFAKGAYLAPKSFFLTSGAIAAARKARPT